MDILESPAFKQNLVDAAKKSVAKGGRRFNRRKLRINRFRLRAAKLLMEKFHDVE
jgi:hypothetical protein